jgi:Mce-associated membrane protein
MNDRNTPQRTPATVLPPTTRSSAATLLGPEKSTAGRDFYAAFRDYPRKVLIGSETSQAAADTAETSPEIDDGEAEFERVSAAEETNRSDGPPGGTRRRWLLVGAGIVVAALLVIELVMLLSARSQVSNLKALDHAQATALAAASQYAAEVASYDYHHLNQDFALVESNSTASFRTQFSNSSAALRPILTQYHAVAKAKVVAAGLESATTNRAVASVFINQTVSNTTQKSGPTTDQSRLELTLVRQHGKWLIENLKLL